MMRAFIFAGAALVACVSATAPACAQDEAAPAPNTESVQTFESFQEPPAAERADDAGIEWQLVNPFRFFNDARDTENHAQAYQWLTDAEKSNPVLSIERRLAARNPVGWAANMAGPTCWDQESNRHRCPDGSDYIFPKSHPVTVKVTGLVALGGEECEWEMAPPRGNQRSRRPVAGKVLRISVPCNTAAKFDIPYPQGATVSVSASGRTIARQLIKVRDVFIVGMGDSFGSGEGNPDKPVRFSDKRTADYGKLGGKLALAGYPARTGNWEMVGDIAFDQSGARWLDQACHRSLYSHQLRAALQLAIEDPHRAVTFAGVACSGAEITHGLFLRYKGNEWVPNPPDLSQLSAIAQAQCGEREAPSKDYPEAYHMRGRIAHLKGGLILRNCPVEHARAIDLVLLSVGGNDIGFARLVANAVLRDSTTLRRLGGWFGQVFSPEDTTLPMEELGERYKALNRALHNILHLPWDQQPRVIITAYPGMSLLDDGRSVCSDGRLGMDVLPQYSLNARRALDGEKVAEQLFKLMSREAKNRGWRVASSHREQFLGRGICAGSSDLTAADELRLPRMVDGYWQPYNPANFEPYAARQRWFRTPNDAFMTGNFHASGKLLMRLLGSSSLQWTQLLLASTYSGAFHPTAEGQAAMADAVVNEARPLLDATR